MPQSKPPRFLVAVAFAAALFALGVASASAGDPPFATSGSLSISSDLGDSVGFGQSYAVATPNDSFLGASDWTNSVVHLNVHTADGHSWIFTFGAPFDQQLLPGTYAGATRFRGFGNPGLDVSHDSFGCNQTSGSFTVLQASYAGYGYLLRFHATFEQHCEGAAAALHGEIDIVNPTPPPAPTASAQLSVDLQGQLTNHGAAIVHGTVSCSTATNFAPTIYLDVSEQTRAGTVAMQTYTYGDTYCSPAPQRWQATIYPPAKSSFAKGTATVTASTGMADPWYPLLTDSASSTVGVQLTEG